MKEEIRALLKELQVIHDEIQPLRNVSVTEPISNADFEEAFFEKRENFRYRASEYDFMLTAKRTMTDICDYHNYKIRRMKEMRPFLQHIAFDDIGRLPEHLSIIAGMVDDFDADDILLEIKRVLEEVKLDLTRKKEEIESATSAVSDEGDLQSALEKLVAAANTVLSTKNFDGEVNLCVTCKRKREEE